jgi:transglutaminase/protease-like cytokinesis protein 3
MGAGDFHRALETHYFLTRPEQLLYSHLPSNASWQLVANSERVSYGVFVRRTRIWPAYFDLQLQVIEPQNSPELIFDRKRGLTKLLIRAPVDVIISSSLEINNIKTLKEQSFIQFLHERQVW